MSKQPLPASVGATIRQLRKRARLTIERLAELADVDATYLGAMERGTENPTLRVLGSVASALKVDLSTLVDPWPEADPRALRRALAAKAATLSADELRRVLRILDAIRL